MFHILPRGVLAAGAAVLVALLLVVEQWPYRMWPLQGIAVGLLAGTAAWCFDEPSASIVDTLPRSLLWRTAVRSTGVVGLVLVWIAVVALTDSAYFGHATDVGWQGLAAVVGTAAYVTWRRTQGIDLPARGVSAAVVTLIMFVALVRPFEDRLPIFPYTAGDDWATSRALWSTLALVATAVLVVCLTRPAGLARRPLEQPA